MFECRIKIRSGRAVEILKSIEIENRGYVTSELYGDKITFSIKSNNLKSFSRTLDDLMDAISLALRILEE